MQQPSTMTRSKGSVLETLTLYSDRCVALLKQVLESEKSLLQASSWTAALSTPQIVSDDSDSESDDDDFNAKQESASSSSSAEECGQEDDEGEEVVSQSQDLSDTLLKQKPPSRDGNNSQAKKKKMAKPSQTQQQQQFAVKKHVESLVCVSLPIHVDAGSSSSVLEIPNSLISKHRRGSGRSIAERNYVPESPCRALLSLSHALQVKPVVVILLRSGRFAAGVFQASKCIVHRACQRYTIRKGQGKAQSTQDASRRPKSIGSQLRRAGEENLQKDIHETMIQWKAHVQQSVLVLLSCPKAMNKYLFDAIQGTGSTALQANFLAKDDARIRRLPLDVGRPTFENVCIAHQAMTTVIVRESVKQSEEAITEELHGATLRQPAKASNNPTKETEKPKETVFVPLTPLHEACQRGDVEAIQALLSDPGNRGDDAEIRDHPHHHSQTMINLRTGPDFMTCLHYAAASTTFMPRASQQQGANSKENNDGLGGVDPDVAAACVTHLLIVGKADPGIVDARNRPPYFLALHEKVRDAFRMARACLGEDFCLWDEDAKVGPPLTTDDIQARKEKDAEKKRKKRAKQREKKAQDKAHAEQEVAQKQHADELKRKDEEAKRVRDGLKPKAVTEGGIACDFCQTIVKGKKRKDMFSRLEYVYCSSECVQKHKRELLATAALARFG